MNESNRASFLLQILLIVGVIAIVGALGFYAFEKDVVRSPPFEHITIWDSLWWVMVTMTTIGYGDIYPFTVEGRLIALVLMFVGIGALGVSTAAIAAYFIQNDQFQLLRLRGTTDHVVICGLGEKGLLLTRAFRERLQPVVVIEENESNDFIASCRELGAIVLIGDATEKAMLLLARVPQARYLVGMCGDDGVNAQIAAISRELVVNRTGAPLTCSIHIVNADLWYLLRRWELAKAGAFRLQFFNVFDIGARALLEAYSPFANISSAPNGNGQSVSQNVNRNVTPPHLLVVGASRLGQSLAVHAARAWRDQSGDAEENSPRVRMRLTLLGEDTARTRDFLHLRHPELVKVCEITSLSLDFTSPEFHHGRFLFDESGNCIISTIYICLDENASALSAALALHNRVARYGVPIVVRLTQKSGLAALLQSLGEDGRGFETLHAIGLLERACQPDLVLGGINEMLARAIHVQYLSDQERAGNTPQTNAQMVSWDQLTEESRESNRSQADFLGARLSAIGCDLAPLTDWDAAAFVFTDAEVEIVAQLEHERWMADRLGQGWTHGPRSTEKKTNENLLPWPQLPDRVREMNRAAAREIPASLAQAGFQIYRLPPS